MIALLDKVGQTDRLTQSECFLKKFLLILKPRELSHVRYFRAAKVKPDRTERSHTQTARAAERQTR